MVLFSLSPGIRAKLLAVLALPIVGMGFFAVQRIAELDAQYDEVTHLLDLTSLAARCSHLVHELQKERGMSAGFIGSSGAHFGPELRNQRHLTDARFEEYAEGVDAWIASGGEADVTHLLENVDVALERMRPMRDQVDALAVPLGGAVSYYSELNSSLLGIIGEMTHLTGDAAMVRHLVAYENFLEGKERSGLERARLSIVFAKDYFGPGDFATFLSLVEAQSTYFRVFEETATDENVAHFRNAMADPSVEAVERLRRLAVDRADTGGFGQDPVEWFATITEKIELLKALDDYLAADLDQQARDIIGASRQARTWTLVGSVIVFVLVMTITLLFTRVHVKRIWALRDHFTRVADGDHSVQVEKPGHDELGQLGTAFNAMVQMIRSSFEKVNAQSERARAAAQEAEEARHAAQDQQAYLSESVDLILESMAHFADGDLTVRLEVNGDDEIGRLFTGFNTALERLHEMLRQVNHAVSLTADAAVQVSGSSENLAVAMHEQSAQASEVAAAIEEMSASILENARSAARTADVADESGQVAAEGGGIVGQTVQKIRQIAEVVQTSAQVVEQLGASSKQIGEIVSVIEGIAEQTNLLALNAAIEAARAGEQGKGFAVVADEVRQLAERTTEATTKIAAMITSIQTETDRAVGAIQAGTSRVDEGLNLSDRAGHTLEHVVSKVQEAVSMVAQIATATEEQSTTSTEIARNAEAISTVAGDSARDIQEIAEAGSMLTQLTVSLSELVSQFKINAQIKVRNVDERVHTQIDV